MDTVESESKEASNPISSNNKEQSTTTLPNELLPPNKSVDDILCDPSNLDEEKIKETLVNWKEDLKRMSKRKGGFILNKPSMIVGDWLFLGDSQSAFHLEMLKALGITHILNVTREVVPFHIFNPDHHFKYAQIVIDDANATEPIYAFFDATKQFIDECNPVLNDIGNRILIHCAQGKSRSSSVVIAYLISSVVEWSELEMNRIEYIRECLNVDTFVHSPKDMMASLIDSLNYMEKNELDEVQQLELKRIRSERYDARYLKLNEAYYFTKSCREVISPNLSFLSQLKRYERLNHNGEDTLVDIPTFTSWDNDTAPIWKTPNEKYPIPFPNVVVEDTAHSGCSCVLL